MLSYDLQQLNELLQNISTLIDAAVTLYDENFNSTSAYGVNAHQNFCRKIKSCGFDTHCAKSDVFAFNNFPKNKNAYFYHCHFGFIEIVLKVIFNNITQGYVIIGPFKDENIRDEQIEKIRKFCEDNSYDLQTQLNLFDEITNFSEQKYLALTNIFFNMLSYAQSQNIVTIGNNLFFEKIEPYIIKNLENNLSNDTLQREFFLSEKQLYSIFQTNTGKTPKHYINKLRVIQAKNLIISTDDSLAKISSMVGFSDYNYFIKVFKQYDGKTPFSYRKTKK